jgi:hypothetical protein
MRREVVPMLEPRFDGEAALETCLARCPRPGAREALASCRAASDQAERRVMSGLVPDTHVVCVYDETGAPR